MEKYEKLCSIGEGSYAVVYKCRNRETGENVAIKRFKDTDDDPIIRKTAIQEVKMLKVSSIVVIKRKELIFLFFNQIYLFFYKRNVLGDFDSTTSIKYSI